MCIRDRSYLAINGTTGYPGVTYITHFMFRSQAPDGTLTADNVYAVVLLGPYSGANEQVTKARFLKNVDGNNKVLATRDLVVALDPRTWYKVRCTWWVSQGVLIVRVEYFDGSEWVKLCDDFTDTANNWADSATNRVGLSGYGYYGCWWDDTIIYAPV